MLNGTEYEPHTPVSRISHGLEDMFYTDEKDWSLESNLLQETKGNKHDITLSSSDKQAQNTENLNTFSVDPDHKN